MRVLQCYRFPVKTKIPFDKWPERIEQFLLEQNLTHRSFHYCLEDWGDTKTYRAILDGSECENCSLPEENCKWCREKAASKAIQETACERAARENPFLGEVHVRKTQHDTIQSLNNYNDFSNLSKGEIYAILPKIYRRYGFLETSLIYRDIDFFSRRVPTPAPDVTSATDAYEGSGITLYRSKAGSYNAIYLTVESIYPGDVFDAAPYADSLGALLPGVKYISQTKLLMNDEEQARYETLHNRAKPLIEKARALFQANMPEEKGNTAPEAKVSVASWLKKLGNAFGYTYLGYRDYAYTMRKKLTNGHYACLEFVSNPLNAGADPYVSLCGLGFKHEIWLDSFFPQNPEDALVYFTSAV